MSEHGRGRRQLSAAPVATPVPHALAELPARWRDCAVRDLVTERRSGIGSVSVGLLERLPGEPGGQNCGEVRAVEEILMRLRHLGFKGT
jgi:hypothetical protein